MFYLKKKKEEYNTFFFFCRCSNAEASSPSIAPLKNSFKNSKNKKKIKTKPSIN